MKRNKKEKITFEDGSGNVFADLGLPNAGELLAKAKLARTLCILIEKSGLCQAEVARRLGIDQPNVSALRNGKLRGFSMERLFRLLNAMGQDVEIIVRKHSARSREQARVTVGLA